MAGGGGSRRTMKGKDKVPEADTSDAVKAAPRLGEFLISEVMGDGPTKLRKKDRECYVLSFPCRGNDCEGSREGGEGGSGTDDSQVRDLIKNSSGNGGDCGSVGCKIGKREVREKVLYVTVSDRESAINDWIEYAKGAIPGSLMISFIGFRAYRSRGNTGEIGLIALCSAGKRVLLIPLQDVKADNPGIKLLSWLLTYRKVALVGCNLAPTLKQLRHQIGLYVSCWYDLDDKFLRSYNMEVGQPPDDLEEMATVVLDMTLPPKAGNLRSGTWSLRSENQVGIASIECYAARRLALKMLGLDLLEAAEGTGKPKAKGWKTMTKSSGRRRG